MQRVRSDREEKRLTLHVFFYNVITMCKLLTLHYQLCHTQSLINLESSQGLHGHYKNITAWSQCIFGKSMEIRRNLSWVLFHVSDKLLDVNEDFQKKICFMFIIYEIVKQYVFSYLEVAVWVNSIWLCITLHVYRLVAHRETFI